LKKPLAKLKFYPYIKSVKQLTIVVKYACGIDIMDPGAVPGSSTKFGAETGSTNVIKAKHYHSSTVPLVNLGC